MAATTGLGHASIAAITAGSWGSDAGAPNSSASWADTFLNTRAATIYAGSSQIQRNIIGEMVLGLPKEPR